MNADPSALQRPFDPADYPALRQFLPAYLHQDFRLDYGSAAEAVKGFTSEASGDDILQVQEEWKTLRAHFRQRPFEQMQAALRALGAAWLPAGEPQLREIDEILSRAQA